MIVPGHTIKLLDKGYIKYIGHLGSDESFVEAARMSTGKGFLGWYWLEDTYNDAVCPDCRTQHIIDTLPTSEEGKPVCINCWGDNIHLIATIAAELPGPAMPKELVVPKLAGKKGAPRDLGLLNTLYSNKHLTPFEMGEIIIEVKAPIFVFREWFRHRTQSYNEFSGRYSVMPNEYYVPDPSRMQKQSTANKQGSAEKLSDKMADYISNHMDDDQDYIHQSYKHYLEQGLSKEVARINTPISCYSKMRAKANIRNWLGFLLLRMDKAAQWEIRVYANVLASIIKELFPRTYELFLEHDLMGQNFSRTELALLRMIVETADPNEFVRIGEQAGISEKKIVSLLAKINRRKDVEYKDAL